MLHTRKTGGDTLHWIMLLPSPDPSAMIGCQVATLYNHHHIIKCSLLWHLKRKEKNSSSGFLVSSVNCKVFLSPSGDLGIGLVGDNRTTGPHQTDFLVPLLKFSSNWTKSSMMGPQLFLGWCQMILDVFRCSQLFSDVFIWVVTFIKLLPVQCITTPCAHILWSSLYEVWQDQDASVGNQIGPNSTT